MMTRQLLFSFLILVPAAVCAQDVQPVITQRDKDIAATLVAQMTLEEKCLLVTGQGDGMDTAPIKRLGIPSVRFSDGPQGVKNKKKESTYYPCGMSLAASFNRNIAHMVGDGIGRDACARGVRVMLCPGVNIYRSPLSGRNFEYYGEDPYLASEIALSYITGIQKHRVAATIKHFAANNQEYDRHGTGSVIDERTLNEIYFPTFRKAVEKGNVGGVMASYNMLNGGHTCEDVSLLSTLRSWGHEGIIMSDWSSTYTTLGCLQSSLDVEMPRGFVLNAESVKPFIANGAVTESVLDSKCQHILQLFSAYGLLTLPMRDETIALDNNESADAAYKAAQEGPVLLKNESVLPVRPSSKNNIVLLGPNADYVAYGGGSGSIYPFPDRLSTLYQGMSRLGKGYKLTLLGNTIGDADIQTIRNASLVIVSVGYRKFLEGEAHDRTYSLPDGQDETILKACGLNDNVLVIINSGGEVDIAPWKDKVKAIILAWYGGQAGGQALADIISGKLSPSGKLPFTFWGSWKSNPVSSSYEIEIPEVHLYKADRDCYRHVEYREGVFLGYRGVEHFGVKPMYPFGYGLSYSMFEYGSLTVTPVADGYDVSFNIRNTGKCDAAEVAQLYLSPKGSPVLRPDRELKGFEKVFLKKGETKNCCIHLDEDAFKYFDTGLSDWTSDPAEFTVMVGSSSQDIRLTETLERAHRVEVISYTRGKTDTSIVVLPREGEYFRLKKTCSELAVFDSLDVRPLFARSRAGEKGYFLFPNGMLCRFPHSRDRRYELAWQPMPISGSLTGEGCNLAIVKGLRFECSLNNELKNGNYSMYYRFRFNDMKAYEDLVIDWYELTGEDASYSGMGRRYRRYQLERGEVRPLKERIKENEYLAYAAQAPEIRIRQGWKPVPPTVLEQTPETEPPMKLAVTFDRVKDIIDRLEEKGIDKAEICLVGWNARGHDGRWPDVFPVEPALGGEVKLKELVAYSQAKGYQIVGHGNTSDIYRIGSGFEEDLVCKRKDGSLFTTEAWAGGQMYKSCMCEAYQRVARKQNSEASGMGFKGLYYIDVHSNNYPTVCHDPKHPHNLKEQANASLLHMKDAAQKMGAVASEGPFDFVASCEDYVLYVTFDLAKNRWNPMVDSYVPLWNIVYNGIILNNAGTETVNYTIKEPALALKAVEFGSRPSFYFYSSFRDDGWHWMGTKDLRCSTEEELTASVNAIAKAWDQQKELGYLQYEFLEEHKTLAESVYLSRWSDGSEIVVNYSPIPFVYKGASIPSMNYKLIK